MLISGTIATFFPSSSFTPEVHALSDYGLMEDAYNSKYLQYNKENIDCTNFNLNSNGLNVDGIPKSLTGLLADAAAEADSKIETSVYGTEENRLGSYEKDFVFKCLNDNDNELIISPSPPTPTPPNPPPPPPPCEVTVDTITGLGNITGLESSPIGIAYDPVNKRMYVINSLDDTVSVIDTTTNTVIDPPI